MEPTHLFSRRSLVWLFLINLLFLGLIDGGVYFLTGYIFPRDTFWELMGMATRTPELEAWAASMLPVFAWIKALFFPVTLVLFLLLALIQWAVLRACARRSVAGQAPIASSGKHKKDPDVKKAVEPKAPGVSETEIRRQHQRYYLHLISLLQRQGRLLDFFREDLSSYPDAQIGAAVRSIHENCAAAIEKQLSPRPVMDPAEGEPVTVPADFDPSALKLTGNVTGDPPFNGVLRHRGWRAGKLDLPVLSSSGDPAIIAPAEVEIT